MIFSLANKGSISLGTRYLSNLRNAGIHNSCKPAASRVLRFKTEASIARQGLKSIPIVGQVGLRFLSYEKPKEQPSIDKIISQKWAQDPDASKPTLEIDAFEKSQRRNRPISPHFVIYQPQITWLGSIVHRVTGAGLAFVVYMFTTIYLVTPFRPEDVINVINYVPGYIITPLKAAFAVSFSYHMYNGIRHLIWDTVNMLENKDVSYGGWAVIALSVITAGALMMIK